jgi:hypothetical protein
MHGAEMKVVREGLGLSTRWLAKRWDKHEQAVQRWETKDWEIPGEVARDVHDLREQFFAAVATTIASLGILADNQEKLLILPQTDDYLLLTEAFPAATLRAVAFHVVAVVPDVQIGWRGGSSDRLSDSPGAFVFRLPAFERPPTAESTNTSD